MEGQYLGVQEPLSRQQSGYNEMQLQQQQMMYQQLQEFQREQQLPQANPDLKLCNSMNQLFATSKKTSSGQSLSSPNGIPLQNMCNKSWQNDFTGIDPKILNSSSMFNPGNMSITHHNGPLAIHSFPNGIMPSCGQDQSLQQRGFPTTGLNQSLYGMPISGISGNCQKQSFQPHGMWHDFSAVMSKACEHEEEKILMYSTAYDTSCNSQSIHPAEHYSEDTLSTAQTFVGRNLCGHIPAEPTGSVSNFQQVNPFAQSVQVQDCSGRHHHPELSGNFQEKEVPQVLSSQGSVGLDPTEQKILFSDDEIWDNSFGVAGNMLTGGMLQGNFMDGSNLAFPSIHSGSWSALMQSAVAETSSSDTGFQDEMGGLDFHKTELSGVNHSTRLSGKLQSPWFDRNPIGSSSSLSRNISSFNDGKERSSNHNFSGFQQFSKDGVWTEQSYEKTECVPHSAENNELCSSMEHSPWAKQQNLNTISSQTSENRFGWNGNDSQLSGGEATFKSPHNEISLRHAQMNNTTENSHVSSTWVSNGNHVPISSADLGTCSRQQEDSSVSNIVAEMNSNSLRVNQEMKRWELQEHEAGYERLLLNNSSANPQVNKSLGNHSLVPAESFPIWESSKSGHDLQSHTKSKAELHARSNIPVHDSETYASGSTVSQNMLELFRKVDNSEDFKAIKGFGVSEQTSTPDRFGTTVLNESVVVREHSQASVLQGYGLQLAPPSQRLSASKNAFLSKPSSQSIISGISDHLPSVLSLPPNHKFSQGGDWDNKATPPGQTSKEIMNSNMRNSSFISSNSRSSCERNQMEDLQISSESGNAALNQSNGMPFRSQLDPTANSRYSSHSQQKMDAERNSVASQPSQASFHGISNRISSFRPPDSPDNNIAVLQPISINNSVSSPPINIDASYVCSSSQQLPLRDMRNVSQPSLTSVISRNGGFSTILHNVWTNISAQRLLQKTIPNASAAAPQRADGQDHNKSGVSSDSGTYHVSGQNIISKEEQQSQGKNRQKELPEIVDRVPQTSASQFQQFAKHGTSSTNADISAYCQIQNQKYSLLQQVQALKILEARRANEKLKQAEYSCSIFPQMIGKSPRNFINGYDNVVRGQMESDLSAVVNHNSLSFTSDVAEDEKRNQRTQVIDKDISSQNLDCFGQPESQTHSSTATTPSSLFPSVRGVEHIREGSQVTPSFQWHEASKSGPFQVAYHDSGSTQKTREVAPNHYSSIKVSDKVITDLVELPDYGQERYAWRSASNATASKEQSSSFQLVASEVVDYSLFMRYKRRKIAGFEFTPWHKQIEQALYQLQTISMTERDWARATSRVTEKAEHGFEIRDNQSEVPRARKRLTLTTQLMQQVLPPAPVRILLEPSPTVYESATYLVAKLALGSACSTLSYLASDFSGSAKNQNVLSGETKTSVKEGDQVILRMTENFVGRAKRLEDDLVRLENGASMLDVRVECQDLERFSIINRFAKFHGRGHQGGVEGSSIEEATSYKIFLCRYVTAMSVPGNLPEGVVCLSL